MGFNIQPFWQAELAVQIHAVTAWLALLIGGYVFTRRKGGRLHKNMGKIWVGLMVIVALSSFFIHQLRTWGLFSPIHLLSIFTLGSLVFSIVMIRRQNIRAHKFSMIGLFIGGLVVTGALTFSKGLLMHRIFFPYGGGIPAYSDMPGGVFGVIFGVFFLVFFAVLASGGILRKAP